MKNILVPTDFSDNADNAIAYAFYFAEKTLATVHLFHAFQIDTPVTDDVTQHMLRKWVEDEKRKVRQSLQEVAERIRAKTGADPDVEFIAAHGEDEEEILKHAGADPINMVIMGTKGAGEITNRFFGSTTAEIVENSEVPVLCIPHKAQFRLPLNIVYATEYQYADIEVINRLARLAAMFNASIKLLHISRVENKAEQILYQDRYREMIERHFDYDKVTYEVIHGSGIPETLSNYAEAEKVHLLAMSTHRRTVWERLFDRSNTQYMAYHAKTPLLVFKSSKQQQ